MPKYTFICEQCKTGRQRVVSTETTSITCEYCKSDMPRSLPTLNGPSNVTEIVDKYTGIAKRRDQKEEVQERREEYYWTVEVPRFVSSGVYTLETMLENGWVRFDDHGHMHTVTKPPGKR